MEDLITTMSRIESLKNLAKKKRVAKKARSPLKDHDDSSLERGLMDAMGALDFGSSFTEDKSFFDVDSALAARSGGMTIDDYFDDSDF